MMLRIGSLAWRNISHSFAFDYGNPVDFLKYDIFGLMCDKHEAAFFNAKRLWQTRLFRPQSLLFIFYVD